ncbi:hypothetical protein [Nocardia sp. CA-290969]|uniref:hypothetical protein n=1 Tax=Nocardia sp. CA-290969 TaxID=3239986 RepID=UPI003D949610
MYGYRYRPDGRVFTLRACARDEAELEVIVRRQAQRRNHSPVTVELVERVGDKWRPVPLSSEDGGDDA